MRGKGTAASPAQSSHERVCSGLPPRHAVSNSSQPAGGRDRHLAGDGAQDPDQDGDDRLHDGVARLTTRRHEGGLAGIDRSTPSAARDAHLEEDGRDPPAGPSGGGAWHGDLQADVAGVRRDLRLWVEGAARNRGVCPPSYVAMNQYSRDPFPALGSTSGRSVTRTWKPGTPESQSSPSRTISPTVGNGPGDCATACPAVPRLGISSTARGVRPIQPRTYGAIRSPAVSSLPEPACWHGPASWHQSRPTMTSRMQDRKGTMPAVPVATSACRASPRPYRDPGTQCARPHRGRHEARTWNRDAHRPAHCAPVILAAMKRPGSTLPPAGDRIDVRPCRGKSRCAGFLFLRERLLGGWPAWGTHPNGRLRVSRRLRQRVDVVPHMTHSPAASCDRLRMACRPSRDARRHRPFPLCTYTVNNNRWDTQAQEGIVAVQPDHHESRCLNGSCPDAPLHHVVPMAGIIACPLAEGNSDRHRLDHMDLHAPVITAPDSTRDLQPHESPGPAALMRAALRRWSSVISRRKRSRNVSSSSV